MKDCRDGYCGGWGEFGGQDYRGGGEILAERAAAGVGEIWEEKVTGAQKEFGGEGLPLGWGEFGGEGYRRGGEKGVGCDVGRRLGAMAGDRRMWRRVVGDGWGL